MTGILSALVFLLFAVEASMARDVVMLADGTRRAGGIAGFDGNIVRLRVALPGALVASAGGSATATVSIPLGDIESIEFWESPERSALLREAGVSQLLDVELEWIRMRPWLGVPRSAAAAIGCTFGELLLARGSAEDVATAFELFRGIEGGAWKEADRMRAKQGRLRAMVASGSASEAVAEAEKIAEEFEDPVILIEAHHIMARAMADELEAFLKENPRWNEDTRVIDDGGTRVIDQRHKLHRRALELFLYPALFYGADSAKAARGLWGAVGIHRLGGDEVKAMETARDIVQLYPATPEAKHAAEFLSSLPPELCERDAAKEALEEMASAASAAVSQPKATQPDKP